MSLEWRGPQVLKSMMKAARFGINKTMSECVMQAKHNHPFRNRTTTAEKSIRIAVNAQTRGDVTEGLWGSLQTNYFIFLELGTNRMRSFATLRPAAKKIYPRLPDNIRMGLARG